MSQSNEKRKRPRALQACDICRVRKNRCSEDRPSCTYCVEHELTCSYSRSTRPAKRQKVFNPSEPVLQVQQQSNLVDNRESFQRSALTLGAARASANDSPLILVDEHPIEKSPVETDVSPLMPHVPSSRIPAISLPRRNGASQPSSGPDSRRMKVEYYGPSSSVAFLRQIEALSAHQDEGVAVDHYVESSSVHVHATSIDPPVQTAAVGKSSPGPDNDPCHLRVASRFIHGYFSNLHCIQPMLDEESFLSRCDDLWAGKGDKQGPSFVALYFAVLSLGALTMTLADGTIAGESRFLWSRKFFEKAAAIMRSLSMNTDMEMVQCYYMLSKISQHELRPHIAYLYAGQATRTALAIGLNRRPTTLDGTDPRASLEAWRTWWAVYGSDIQISFGLGRPDSVGPDEYHTRCLPISLPNLTATDQMHVRMVTSMTALARISRKVALELYTAHLNGIQRVHKARELDAELQEWLRIMVPAADEDPEKSPESLLKPKRAVSHQKKQSVALQLGFMHLRTLIHAVSVTHVETSRSAESDNLSACRCSCLTSAEAVIDLIYETFRESDWFQSWWCNITHTLFAVTTLLGAVFRQLARTQNALDQLFSHVDRAVSILKAMDECDVAKKAAAIVQRTVARARRVPQRAINVAQVSTGVEFGNFDSDQPTVPAFDFQSASLADDFAWFDPYAADDQTLFWTEWAREMDNLGLWKP